MKFFKPAIVAAGVALIAVATIGVPAAQAANPRTNEKVTICHRTHATTNPYRQITVSMASIIGAGGSGNGHGDTSSSGRAVAGVTTPNSHNPYYTAAGSVFNPTFTYPSNHKQWQDIIPPFTYVKANQSQQTFAGLNWDDKGQAIYYGYTYGGVNYAGLCSKMSVKQFADREFSAGQSKNDALTDAKEQAAEEDGNLDGKKLNSKTFDNLPNPTQNPKGPEVPEAVKSLQDDLDTYNNANPAVIKQAIAGVVWEDSNRNGLHDNGERLFEAVGIELVDPATGQPYVEPVSFKSKNKPGTLLTAGISIRTAGTTITGSTTGSFLLLINKANTGSAILSLYPFILTS